MKKVLILVVVIAAVAVYMMTAKQDKAAVVEIPEASLVIEAPVVEEQPMDTSGNTSIAAEVMEDTSVEDMDMGDAPSMVDTSTLEVSETQLP